MNHSKYNPKYDPKHTSTQPQAAVPVVQAPAVTPVVNTPPAQAATAPPTETRNPDEVIAEPNRQDAKADSQDVPVAMNAAAPVTDKNPDVSISDGREPAIGNSVHAVREPSALTGGLPELPAAQTDSETGENTPGLSAKAIA
ncbi:MAG: hypothetical protein ACYDCJ_05730 [Gammaproteobacteria bacterium]